MPMCKHLIYKIIQKVFVSKENHITQNTYSLLNTSIILGLSILCTCHSELNNRLFLRRKMLGVYYYYYYCPSARCASVADVVCRDVDVFGARNILLRHLL
jgi:hypothetical protein